MEKVYYDIAEDLDRYVSVTDNEVLSEINRASRDEKHPGHFDAQCLYLRKHRFRAIALSAPPEEKDLLRLKNDLSIPDDEISWEMGRSVKKRMGLPFPVLKQDGTVDVGDNLSEISIPPKERSWIFVAPQYETAVRETLNSVDVLA